MLLVKHCRENTAGGLGAEPQHAARQLSDSDRLEIEKVELRMALRDLSHAGHGCSGVWEQDVATQFEEAQDGAFLVVFLQLLERSRQVTSCALHGCTADAVVPV